MAAPTDSSLRVAVIIPTYNRWPHVAKAIDSALRQSHPPTEIIVVDDGSTDGTPEHVRARYGDRVRLLVKEQNGEKSRARNDGVQTATAEFVCMLDSDDRLLPNSLADRLRVFCEQPDFNGVAYGATRYPDAKSARDILHLPSGHILDAYLDDLGIMNNNAYLLRRDQMLRYGMYRPELTHMEDRELLIRLTAQLPFHFCGSVTQEVRRVDRSARCDYESLLRQGRAMTTALRRDARLRETLDGRFEDIAYLEASELARALYRTKRYQGYMHAARELRIRYPARLRGDRRFLRRRAVAWTVARVGQASDALRQGRRVATAALACLIVLALTPVAYMVVAQATLPNVQHLQDQNPKHTAFMVHRAGAGEWSRTHEVVDWADIDDIAPVMRHAIVMSEDGRFYEHAGIDRKNTRKAVRRYLLGRPTDGASTITQQLARNLYLDETRSAHRKAREMMLAHRLERALPKTRILELYLNLIEWGDGIWGITQAAQHYFNKAPSELDLFEAILLASIVPAPRSELTGSNLERATRLQRRVLADLLHRIRIEPGDWQRTATRLNKLEHDLRDGQALADALNPSRHVRHQP